LFHADGAPGILPSELSPPARYPACLHPEAPTYRFRSRYTRRKAAGQHGSPRFLGFCPRESPLPIATRVNAPPAGCSLGFCPPRVFLQRSSPSLRSASSPALSDEAMPRGRRLRVSIDHCLAIARIHGKPGTATATLSGFSHLVSPGHSGNLPAGLCVRLTPCGTSLPTIGDL